MRHKLQLVIVFLITVPLSLPIFLRLVHRKKMFLSQSIVFCMGVQYGRTRAVQYQIDLEDVRRVQH